MKITGTSTGTGTVAELWRYGITRTCGTKTKNMIPKIIHYCWFGGNPLPELAQRCIASWRKFFPDYEIWQWTDKDGNGNVNGNEDSLPFTVYRLQGSENENKDENVNVNVNVNKKGMYDRNMSFDVNIVPYTAEAYRQKKYAFVSDYARFWIMYKYGGIYFDTDVEVIRPMDDIIARGNFMGFEVDPDGENTPGRYAPRYCFGVNPGVGFGIVKRHSFLKRMLDLYADLEFQPVPADIAWYKTIVAYTTEELCCCGLKNMKGIQSVQGINIYPRVFFSPINVVSGKCKITEKTCSIHRFSSTWSESQSKTIKDYLRHYLPEWVFYLHNRIKRRKYRIK